MATRISTAFVPALDLGGNVITLLRSVQLPSLDLAQGRPPGGDMAGGIFTEWQAEVALGGRDALSDWLAGFTGTEPTVAMAGSVLVLDGNNGVSRQVDFFDGQLMSLAFAPLEATGKVAMTAQFSVSAGRLSYPQPSAPGRKPSLPPTRRKAVMASAFRLKGLPFDAARQLMRVQLPTLQAPANAPGSLQISELELSFSGAAAREAALAWALKQAQAPLVEPQAMVVELLDAALKDTLISFQLQGCVLLAYSESAVDSGSTAQPSATLRFSVGSLKMDFAAG